MKNFSASLVCAAILFFALSQSVSAQAVKEALLAENGFNADWTCSSDTGRAETGRSEVTFKAEGSKVIVNVNNFARGSCKSDVAVGESGASWNACRGTPIQMTYDANDKSVPFKGTGGRCTYQFKLK